MKITYYSNSINLWNRIKKQLITDKSKKFKVENNKFNINKKSSEEI